VTAVPSCSSWFKKGADELAAVARGDKISRMARLLAVLFSAVLIVAAAGAGEAPPLKRAKSEDAARVLIVERKLEDWRIKKVIFSEAGLDDAVAFFKAEAKKADPEQKGLNFVVSPAASAAAAGGKITLALDDVPLAVALRYAVETIGLEYRVEPFVILIDKPAAKASP
jgi:hypothetical protein